MSKAEKELFVSGLAGGPLPEIYAVVLVAVASVVAHTALKRLVLPKLAVLRAQPLAFVAEFCLDILVPLQAITVYSGRLHLLYGAMTVITLGALAFSAVGRTRQKQPQPKQAQKQPLLAPRPFLTAYRGHMLILTNLCILAVDFHLFPRRLAKVETWGTSLMDMGVGMFVFSMGLVNARSLVKQALAPAEQRLYFGVLAQNTKKALPVLALGLIRLVSVKSLEYQEHVTEYGVHWNFFMTLGLLPIVLAVLDPLFRAVPRCGVALLVAVCYEFALSYLGLSTFVLDESNRAWNIVTLNKEGVCSFFGYLSIFIFGQSFGLFVLTSQKTPNNLIHFKSSGPARKHLTVSTVRGLVICLAVYLVLFAWAKDSVYCGNVSRRLANLPYVLWVVSFSAVLLLCLAVSEAVMGPCESVILSAINRNGLAIFLAANLSTGLINMSVDTLRASNQTAYLILVGYACIWVFLAVFLDHRQISIKL